MRSRAHEECNSCGKGRADLAKHDAEALRSIDKRREDAEALRSIDKRRKDFSGHHAFHEEIMLVRGNACLLFVGSLSPGPDQSIYCKLLMSLSVYP